MKHLVGHVTGSSIATVNELESKMNQVVEEQGFHEVARAFHQFDPIGATGVIVLAESHFSAHTYPENDLIYFDVFCCSPSFQPMACATSIERIFEADSSKWDVVDRSP
jgi:S-adenosylmethionine decarboxylase proenzyme